MKYILLAMLYELWNGEKMDVPHLQEFGAPVWVLTQGQRILRKMLPKSHRQAYIGYDEGSKSIKFYNASTRSILTSQNFHFLIPSTASPPEELAIDPPNDTTTMGTAPHLRGRRTNWTNKRPVQLSLARGPQRPM